MGVDLYVAENPHIRQFLFSLRLGIFPLYVTRITGCASDECSNSLVNRETEEKSVSEIHICYHKREREKGENEWFYHKQMRS